MRSGVSQGRLAGAPLVSAPLCLGMQEPGTHRGPGPSRELAPSRRSVLTVTVLAGACRHGHAAHAASLSSSGSSLSLAQVLAHWYMQTLGQEETVVWGEGRSVYHHL